MSTSKTKHLFWLLIPQVVAVLVLSQTIRLAIWQLDRADEKAALLVQWEKSGIVDLEDQALADLPLLTSIRVSGRIDQQRHVLLDNQTRNNHPGVHVFSLFNPDNGSAPFLLNRGWQPWLRTDGTWPEFDTTDQTVEITGRVTTAPQVGLRLGDALPLDSDNWPNLMTYLELSEVRKVVGPQLADRIVLLEPSHSAHLTGDDWPRVNMGPERHRGYAFQWGAITVAIFILWISLTVRQIIKSRRNRRS